MNKSISGLTSQISKNLSKCNVNKQIKYFECGIEYEDFTDLIQFTKNLNETFLQ